jgi:hypothetical protein
LMDVTRGFMIPELTFVDAGRMDADGPEAARAPAPVVVG